ncbi:MAG: phospho-N-acetylmuramoyl-pentapeptide-transferase [Acidimicrobiales bacterium]
MSGILIGAGVALLVAFLSTPPLTRVLRAKGVGQPIHEAVTQHSAKSGTPTMGGLVIPAGLVIGYGVSWAATGQRPSEVGLTVVGTCLGGGVVGVVDDWLKVRRGRNLGLRELQKSSMQALVIVGFCVGYLLGRHPCTHLSVTHCATIAFDPGPAGWAVFAAVVIWAGSTGVNFTDGEEGLLAGSGAGTFSALALIGYWEYRHPAQYHLAGAADLALVAACVAGACVGFLWWNTRPATIFMGDSGSLALGMGMAGLALALNVALLLPLLGLLYVLEGASSNLQRYTYRYYFKNRPGNRRLFRMAPLHHHFEQVGWSEHTITVRFWLINAGSAVLALAAFYGSSLAHR